MENRKVLTILFFLILAGCTLFIQPQDGWEYIYVGDPISALREFTSAYNEDQADAKISAGLSYTYLLLDENESSGVYAEKAAEADSSSKYTIFSQIAYTRFNEPGSTDLWFRKYVSENGYTVLGFYLDTIISNGSVYKLGLSGEYISGEFDYTYEIMKKISSIPDTLDMSSDGDRVLLWDYISRISE